MTQFFQGLRDDFDAARLMHQQAINTVPPVCSKEELERYTDYVALRRSEMLEKAMIWAEASSVATQLRRDM